MSDPSSPDLPESVVIGRSKQNGPVHEQLLDEMFQRPITRQPLIRELEDLLEGRVVVTFFTSFVHPVIIEDSDADLLESVLKALDLSRGLCLVLNSPGGDALAAERIIRVCRVYSGDDFHVFVPRAAKSAATMIALGSSCIMMGRTSELGPVDPQVLQQTGDQLRYVPAHAVVTSYEQLLAEATTLAPDAHIEPYLQQLQRYNASEIAEIKKLQALSQDIARQSLSSGMMDGRTDDEVNECVKLFTDWDRTLTHGRAIFPETIADHGLNVRVLDIGTKLWDVAFELYVRTDYYVSSQQASKTFEAAHAGLSVPPPRRPS